MHLYSLNHRTYPCTISHFFRMYNYAVIDSLTVDGYREASGSCGRFDPGDA
jgi:hypothetical protein